MTNGNKTFLVGDGNSAWAKRWRDLVEIYAADLGGRDNISAGRLALVHRTATLQSELESADGRLSLGEEIDFSAYVILTNCLRRVLETIGLNRVSRDVTPSLPSYLQARARLTIEGDDAD